MDLKTAQEESPGAGGESKREEFFLWFEEDEEAGRHACREGGEQREALQGRRRKGSQFEERVEGAPDIGDFVFEEATLEGEDAVDHLDGLFDHGPVRRGTVDVICELGKDREVRGFLAWVWGDAALIVVEGASEKWQKKDCKGEDGRKGDAQEARDVDAREDAAAQQEEEDGYGVVQRHDLETQARNKKHRRPEVAPRHHGRHAGHNEAQHDGVVLEVHMINQNRAGLHEDRGERDRRRPIRHGVETAEAAHKHDQRRHVDEVFGDDNSSAHEDLEVVLVVAARDVESKPSRIDARADLAA